MLPSRLDCSRVGRSICLNLGPLVGAVLKVTPAHRQSPVPLARWIGLRFGRFLFFWVALSRDYCSERNTFMGGDENGSSDGKNVSPKLTLVSRINDPSRLSVLIWCVILVDWVEPKKNSCSPSDTISNYFRLACQLLKSPAGCTFVRSYLIDPDRAFKSESKATFEVLGLPGLRIDSKGDTFSEQSEWALAE